MMIFKVSHDSVSNLAESGQHYITICEDGPVFDTEWLKAAHFTLIITSPLMNA